ncbi:hypothetical protein [Streptomyces sp. NBC_00878]|nr:hypothetical protein [Streptomyces sp. NBC_00878]
MSSLQAATSWALPLGGDERDVVPDECAIPRAPGNLGIAPSSASG